MYKFGISNTGALGDCCYLLAAINELNKRGEEVIIEMHNNDIQSKEVSVVFDGLAKVEFVDNPIPKLYENKREKHAAQIILDKLNITNVNCIPKLLLKKEEIEWAKNYLSKFWNIDLNKCISVAADSAGSHDPNNFGAQYKTPPVELMQYICDEFLQNHYTVFQFGRKENEYFRPLKGAIHIQDLNIRQTAACFSLINNFIGGDSGLYHLNIASGGKSMVACPPDSEEKGYSYKSLHYTPDLWKEEKLIRVKYLDFDGNLIYK